MPLTAAMVMGVRAGMYLMFGRQIDWIDAAISGVILAVVINLLQMWRESRLPESRLPKVS